MKECENSFAKSRMVYLGFVIALIVVIIGVTVIYMSGNSPKRLGATRCE